MSIQHKNPSRTLQPALWRTKYGLWAVVTGASDGIGREMALCLAEAGLNLVLVARRRVELDQLSASLSSRYGIQVRVMDADLTRYDSVKEVINGTDDLEVGLLVACAGFGTSGQLIKAELEPELEMLDVNCRAVLMMSQHFGRRFAQQGRGGLVLMSSLLAFQGVPMSANYAATKAYVQSLAEALYVELAPLGVDVIASAPGPIHSGFAARATMRMSFAAQPASVAKATLNALGRKSTVRPGWLSKLLELSLTALPRQGRVRVMERIMGNMAQQDTQPKD